jgi:ribosomal-protein-alanine N-acetyltransferase
VTFHIREAVPADLDALVAIEDQAFVGPNWRRDDFLKYECLVAEAEGRIAGFLVSREVFAGDPLNPAQREILNIAVANEFRRQGLATSLIQKIVRTGEELFLEVRESNMPARRLYRKLGFVELGTRPKYYQNPVETAIVMNMK